MLNQFKHTTLCHRIRDKRISFFVNLNSYFSQYLQDFIPNEENFMNLKQFETELLLLKNCNPFNIQKIEQHITKLTQHFSFQNVYYDNYVEILIKSGCGKYLIDLANSTDNYPYVPYIFELFINLTSISDDFCKLFFDNYGVETIFHKRNMFSMDEKIQIIILLCLYNITKFSADYLYTDTTEVSSLISCYYYRWGSDNFFYSPFLLMNIIRYVEMSDENINNLFFQNLPIFVLEGDFNTSIYSMWCIYFWFKNSHKYMNNFINKKFIKFILKCIYSKEETISSIGLYVYSIMFFSDLDDNRSLLQKYFPIEDVIQMCVSQSQSISVNAIIMFNNYVACTISNASIFLKQDDVQLLISIFQNCSHPVKVELSFLIITILYKYNYKLKDDLKSFFTQELINVLNDILLIQNYELQSYFLKFMVSFLSQNSWGVGLIMNDNFISSLESFNEYEYVDLNYYVEKLFHIYKTCLEN